MAKQTEEIVVKLTVDTQGIDEFDKKSEESEKATKSWTASFGSLIGTITAGGIALLKFNSILGALNFNIAKNLKSFSLFRITFGSITKAIIAQIPQWIKLRAAIIASGIGALVIALVAIVTALKNTVVGTDFLKTAMKALGNVMQGVVDLFTGLGKAIVGLLTGDWALATEGLAQAWDGVANGIGNAWENASLLVKAQRELNDLMITYGKSVGIAVDSVEQLEKLLDKAGINSREVALWSEKLRDAQLSLITLKLQELSIRENILQVELDGGVGSVRQQEIEKEQNLLFVERLKLAREMGEVSAEFRERAEEERERQQIAIDILNSQITEETELETLQRQERERLEKEHEDNMLLAYIEFLTEKEAADKAYLASSVEEFADAEEEIDEVDQKAIDQQRKNVNTRKKQEKEFEGFKVDAAKQGFAALQGLAGENQIARGALMIAEAIANTAVAISRAPADYGLAGAAVAIPVIAALGAVQVATIAQQMGTGTGESVTEPGLGGFDLGPQTASVTENAGRGFFAANRSIPPPANILVTEDLNTVQSRVRVTEDRASIG